MARLTALATTSFFSSVPLPYESFMDEDWSTKMIMQLGLSEPICCLYAIPNFLSLPKLLALPADSQRPVFTETCHQALISDVVGNLGYFRGHPHPSCHIKNKKQGLNLFSLLGRAVAFIPEFFGHSPSLIFLLGF